MCFGARHHTQKLFSREQLSSSFHLCLLLFLCTLLLCCFFYLDARDQRKRRVSALRLTLLFLQTGMKHTGGKSAREKENSTAGFISSFSSVWLPHICWPFQPSHRPPPSASLHHPLLLFSLKLRVLSASALSRVSRWKLEESTNQHGAKRKEERRETGGKKRKKRQRMGQRGRERERERVSEKTEIIKAVWGP